MAWTAPPTYTTGQIITAADLNADLRDNMIVLHGARDWWSDATRTFGTATLVTHGNYAAVMMDGNNEGAYGVTHVPAGFGAITGAYAWLIPTTNGTIDWSFGVFSGTTGEDESGTGDSTTADGQAVTDDELLRLDVSAAVDGQTLALGDVMGWKFITDVLTDTTQLYILGVEFTYTQA